MTVARPKQKIGPRKLVALVEQLGELRERAAATRASERELTELVTAAMQAADLTTVESADYAAQLAERRRLTLDPKHVKDRLRGAAMLECFRVDLTAARRRLGTDVVARLADVTTSIDLRVSRRPGR